MSHKEKLFARLNEIGESLKQSQKALALLALGSVGIELDRIDDYSDLDFFVIAKTGYKNYFLNNLDWLKAVSNLAFYFQNTKDGYKALFDDGIFCEFAIFEQNELSKIPFSEGRLVWAENNVDHNICKPIMRVEKVQHNKEWIIGELLTNLYIGICRYKRGEKLSASRFIQSHAVDRVLELAAYLEEKSLVNEDFFSNERRFEQIYPNISKQLPKFIQGYDRSEESALEIIKFIEKFFEINLKMKNAILEKIGN